MSEKNKQELQVAALKNGTVIDHIPSDKLFTVVALLGLQNSDSNITIGNNFESKKLGKKGIIKVIGVLRVMYSPRISLQNLVSNELIQTFGAVVFDTVIPRNVSLAEAPSFGKPVMYYKKTSTGAKAYLDFGRELIRRVKDEVQAVQKE